MSSQPQTRAEPESHSPPAPKHVASPQGAAVQLFVEPVIDLEQARTAMYRAVPGLAAADGDYFGRDAILRAVQDGRGTAAQLEALAASLAFLRRLRAQGEDLSVICPLSAMLLEDIEFARRMALLLHEHDDHAGLLLALDLNELSGLGPRARQGLMWLANASMRFVLEIPELVAHTPFWLHMLDVRHVELSVERLAWIRRHDENWREQAGRVWKNGWAIMASDVRDAAALELIAGMAHFARGAFFAAPRRVRPQEQPAPQAAAAASFAAE